MTTRRQKEAVYFIQEELLIKFNGSINSFKEVSKFLDEYLEIAKSHKEIWEELYYEALCSIGDTYFG